MQLVDDENRETRRKAVSIPVYVEVADAQGQTVSEHGWLLDISASGAGFRISRPIAKGRLVRLRAKVPKEFRLFDFTKPEYGVWGVVRRCMQVKDPSLGSHYAVGAAFIGKNAPADHARDPEAVYELSDLKPGEEGFWKLRDVEINHRPEPEPNVERRRYTRLQVAEPVVLEMVDAGGKESQHETTVTENVSRHGASVFSQLNSPVGSFVRLTVIRRNITLIAIVRDKHIGGDALPRLHIEFIDNLFPLDGVE
jgi:hypothetical protein